MHWLIGAIAAQTLMVQGSDPCVGGSWSSTCSFTPDGMCVQSSGYPDNYPANDLCYVEIDGCVMMWVLGFEVEDHWDFLVVNGEGYSGSQAPPDGPVNGSIHWLADSDFQQSGWQICFDRPAVVPWCAPQGGQWSSSCTVVEDGYCVQSSNYPADYDASERCLVEIDGCLYVHVLAFEIEDGYDYLEYPGNFVYTGKDTTIRKREWNHNLEYRLNCGSVRLEVVLRPAGELVDDDLHLARACL